MIDEQGHAGSHLPLRRQCAALLREDLEAMVEGIRKKSKKN